MGTWGTGLYADDAACDLRDTIGLIARLPRSGDQLFELLCERELDGDPEPALWLVVADQFERRGIRCDAAFARALAVIDDGEDLRDLTAACRRATSASAPRCWANSPHACVRRVR